MGTFNDIKVRHLLDIIDPAAYVVICDGETPIAGGRVLDAKDSLTRNYGYHEVFRLEHENDAIVLTIYR